MTPKHKAYWEMSTEELREATRGFDKQFVPTRPLTKSMQSRLARAKRKRGRPPIGRGATSVLVSLERGLLEQADAIAKRRGLSRSRLIAEALRNVVKSAS